MKWYHRRQEIRRFRVTLYTPKNANDFVKDEKLKEKGLRAFIPENYIYRFGIMK